MGWSKMLASGLVSQLKRGPNRNSHNGDISQSLTMGYHPSPPMMCLSCASLKFHRISARDCSRVGNLAMTGYRFSEFGFCRENFVSRILCPSLRIGDRHKTANGPFTDE